MAAAEGLRIASLPHALLLNARQHVTRDHIPQLPGSVPRSRTLEQFSNGKSEKRLRLARAGASSHEVQCKGVGKTTLVKRHLTGKSKQRARVACVARAGQASSRRSTFQPWAGSSADWLLPDPGPKHSRLHAGTCVWLLSSKFLGLTNPEALEPMRVWTGGSQEPCQSIPAFFEVSRCTHCDSPRIVESSACLGSWRNLRSSAKLTQETSSNCLG